MRRQSRYGDLEQVLQQYLSKVDPWSNNGQEVALLMRYAQLLANHWKNGLSWLFFSGMGMLGLWGFGLVLFMFIDNPPWLDLIDQGQFLLYSVGFLVQPMYVLLQDRHITTIPYRGMLICATLLCFTLCALLSGGYVFANFVVSPDIRPKTAHLRYIGVAILLFSVGIGFLVTIAVEEKQDFDIDESSQAGVRRLDELIPEGSIE